MTSLQEPRAQVNPIANRYDHPDVSELEDTATGLPAVLHAMGHALPNNATPSLLTINKHKGFDCPGCAWPEPDQADLNIVEFCENGAKAVAEETFEEADAVFWADYSRQRAAGKTDHWLAMDASPNHRLRRSSGDDHYRPVSWDKAIGIIAEQLQRTEPDGRLYTPARLPRVGLCHSAAGPSHGRNNLTAQTCVTSPPALPCLPPWGWARGRPL